MRVAALYDVHGMPRALEAVLAELEHEEVDAVVLGGDVVGGPQPVETLASSRARAAAALAARNGERASASTATRDAATSWTAARSCAARARSWRAPETLALEVDGLGRVLFCHAIPRDDTPDHRGDAGRALARALEGVAERARRRRAHAHAVRPTVDGRAGSTPARSGCRSRATSPRSGRFSARRRVPPHAVRRRPRGAAIRATGWPDAEAFVEENCAPAVDARRRSTTSSASRSSERVRRVGRVGKPHGVQGAFFVEHASEAPERFADGRELLVAGEPARGRRVEAVAGGRPVIRLDREVERGAPLEVDADDAARCRSTTPTTSSSSSASRSRRRAAARSAVSLR